MLKASTKTKTKIVFTKTKKQVGLSQGTVEE